MLGSDSERQHIAIRFQPLINFLARGAFQAPQAEILDREAGDDGAISHGAAKPAWGWTIIGAQIAHQAARETIPRARRIDYFVSGETRNHKDTVVTEKRGTVLPFLDNDELGAELANGLPRLDQVAFLG